jgi:hypothetical protein
LAAEENTSAKNGSVPVRNSNAGDGQIFAVSALFPNAGDKLQHLIGGMGQ